MRQDKDRGSKWLLTHFGDAILKLAGIKGFTSWKAVQSESVAPRRLPDGLIEVTFPGQRPVLYLVEVETYPGADVDRQLLEDLMVIGLERGVMPEVISVVLHTNRNLEVRGTAESVSPSGRTKPSGSLSGGSAMGIRSRRVAGCWRRWIDSVGAVVPFELPPEAVLAECRAKIAEVPDKRVRESLLVVTQIMAGLAYPKLELSN